MESLQSVEPTPRFINIGEEVVDENGLSYQVTESGFIDFGDISHNLLARQTQYGSMYLDGVAGHPKLGEGLRVEGDQANYHSLAMHPEDVPEFIRRYHAYQAVAQGLIYGPDGSFSDIQPEEEQVLREYLRSVGAAL